MPYSGSHVALGNIEISDHATSEEGHSQIMRETSQPASKRRRKKIPSSATPQPTGTPEPNTTLFRSSIPKASKARPSTTSTNASARVASAATREEAQKTRLDAPIAHDEPSISVVGRAGMGDLYPPPPESNIREEARYIILAAAQQREQERLQKVGKPFLPDKTSSSQNLPSYPRTDHQPLHHVIQHAGSSAQEGEPVRLYYATAGPSSYTVQPRENLSTFADTGLMPYTRTGSPDSPGLQISYSDIALNEISDDPNPPEVAIKNPSSGNGHEVLTPLTTLDGVSPKVILAPRHPGLTKARNEVEIAHQQGLEGLTAELEADAMGFVDNVRVSVTRSSVKLR